MRDFLLILGMHRSGTSAMAGACAIAGADFGEQLVEAQDDNVAGYFEDRRVLALHDRFLAAAESSWDDIAVARPIEAAAKRGLLDELEQLLAERADVGLPAVKDPRLSRLLGLWLPMLSASERTPKLVIMHRDPHEVAGSLGRRDGFSGEKSALLWADHILSAERLSRGLRRRFVSYEELLADPVTTIDAVGRALELKWPRDPKQATDELREFVDPGLRHWTHSETPSRFELGRGRDVCRQITAALANEGAEADGAKAFDRAANSLLEAFGGVDPLVVSHLLAVSRREHEAALWIESTRLEGELARQVRRLEAGLKDVSEQQGAVGQRGEVLAQRIEEAITTSSAVGARVNEQAEARDERIRTVDAALDYLRSEVTDLGGRREGDLALLTERLDRLTRALEAQSAFLARLRASLPFRLHRGIRRLFRRGGSAAE